MDFSQKLNDQELRIAVDYWGHQLILPNKLPSSKLERLLLGIAFCISTRFPEQHDETCRDLTPSQLASYYRAVGGNYDPLFREVPSQSLAIIYKSLGCLHSLQPSSAQDGYLVPAVPALKPQGFVRWQTIQLLLGPHEHAPFIQNALQVFNVTDPANGKEFMKFLPVDLFPDAPDRDMVEWHNTVGEKLKWEAAQEDEHIEKAQPSEVDIEPTNGSTQYIPSHRHRPLRDERYHKDDKNKDERRKEERPTLIKQITDVPSKVFSTEHVFGRAAKNIIDPSLWNPGRNRSASERTSQGRNLLGKKDDRRDSEQVRNTRRDRSGRREYSNSRQRPVSGQSPRRGGDHGRSHEDGAHGAGNPTRLYESDSPAGRRGGRWRSASSSGSESPPRRAGRQRSVSHESPTSKRDYFSGSAGNRWEDEPPRTHGDYRRGSFNGDDSQRRRSGSRGAMGTPRRRNGSSTSNRPGFDPMSQWSPHSQHTGPTSAPRMQQTQTESAGSFDQQYFPQQPGQESSVSPQQRPSQMQSRSNSHNDMQRSQSQQHASTRSTSAMGSIGSAVAGDVTRRSNSMRNPPRHAQQAVSGLNANTPSIKSKGADVKWQPQWQEQYRPSSGTGNDVYLNIPPADDSSLRRRKSAPSTGHSPRVSPSATPERRRSDVEVKSPGLDSIGGFDFESGSGNASGQSQSQGQGLGSGRVHGVGGRRYPYETPWN